VLDGELPSPGIDVQAGAKFTTRGVAKGKMNSPAWGCRAGQAEAVALQFPRFERRDRVAEFVWKRLPPDGPVTISTSSPAISVQGAFSLGAGRHEWLLLETTVRTFEGPQLQCSARILKALNAGPLRTLGASLGGVRVPR
jgi:hypothetical protein